MNSVSGVSFRGCETAGSIGYKIRNTEPDNKQGSVSLFEKPEQDVVAFRGSDKKSSKAGKVALGVLGTAALIVALLAGGNYANKKGALDKLADGGFAKKILTPVLEFCGKACDKAVALGTKALNAVKGLFKKH